MCCIKCTSFETFLSVHNISPEALQYYIKQGIECDKIKLQFGKALNVDTVDQEIHMLEAQRFLALLTAVNT